MARKFDPAALLEFTGQGTRELARRLGVDAAILCRPFSANQADRYACAVGVHPVSIWADWWVTLEEVSEDELTGDDELDEADDEWEYALGVYLAKVAAGLIPAV